MVLLTFPHANKWLDKMTLRHCLSKADRYFLLFAICIIFGVVCNSTPPPPLFPVASTFWSTTDKGSMYIFGENKRHWQRGKALYGDNAICERNQGEYLDFKENKHYLQGKKPYEGVTRFVNEAKGRVCRMQLMNSCRINFVWFQRDHYLHNFLQTSEEK